MVKREKLDELLDKLKGLGAGSNGDNLEGQASKCLSKGCRENSENEGKEAEEDYVKLYGFFWKFQGIMFFNKAYGSDGFTEEEVKEIAPQVLKAYQEARMDLKDFRRLRERYVSVYYKGSRFKVHIDTAAEVYKRSEPEVKKTEKEKSKRR